MEISWKVASLFLGLVLLHLCNGFPINLENSAADSHTQLLTGLVAVLLTVCSVVFLAGCLCCQRKNAFKEFRDSPVLASVSSNLDHGHINPVPNGEFTIFTPLTPPIQNNNVFLATTQQQLITRTVEDYRHGDVDVSSWFDPAEKDFPRVKLKYIRELGRGWFGKVVEGAAKDINESQIWTPVVVRISEASATSSERIVFLHDAAIYRCGPHPNILALLGRCLETVPLLLLQEYCPQGDLKKYLKANKSTSDHLLASEYPLVWCCQLTSALKHLHDNDIVHPDLATRNCQLTSTFALKLGDYGMAIFDYPDDYYQGSVGVPVRWCSPESLNCTSTTIQPRKVTKEANVWSLGVTMWEICECGDQPYGELSDDEVISLVFGAGSVRLTRPSYPVLYTDYIFRLMQLCWTRSELRPAVAQVDLMLLDLLQVHKNTSMSVDDFDKRWQAFKPNVATKSPSLNNLHGSLDNLLRSSVDFKLGPGPERSSGSETEDESWRVKVERGAYSEQVRLKSRSVADLMVLTHVDCSESESETPMPSLDLKRFGSEGSLLNVQDAFQDELKKLQEERRDSLLFVPDRRFLMSDDSPSKRLMQELNSPTEMQPVKQVFNVFNVTIDKFSALGVRKFMDFNAVGDLDCREDLTGGANGISDVEDLGDVKSEGRGEDLVASKSEGLSDGTEETSGDLPINVQDQKDLLVATSNSEGRAEELLESKSEEPKVVEDQIHETVIKSSSDLQDLSMNLQDLEIVRSKSETGEELLESKSGGLNDESELLDESIFVEDQVHKIIINSSSDREDLLTNLENQDELKDDIVLLEEPIIAEEQIHEDLGRTISDLQTLPINLPDQEDLKTVSSKSEGETEDLLASKSDGLKDEVELLEDLKLVEEHIHEDLVKTTSDLHNLPINLPDQEEFKIVTSESERQTEELLGSEGVKDGTVLSDESLVVKEQVHGSEDLPINIEDLLIVKPVTEEQNLVQSKSEELIDATVILDEPLVVEDQIHEDIVKSNSNLEDPSKDLQDQEDLEILKSKSEGLNDKTVILETLQEDLKPAPSILTEALAEEPISSSEDEEIVQIISNSPNINQTLPKLLDDHQTISSKETALTSKVPKLYDLIQNNDALMDYIVATYDDQGEPEPNALNFDLEQPHKVAFDLSNDQEETMPNSLTHSSVFTSTPFGKKSSLQDLSSVQIPLKNEFSSLNLFDHQHDEEEELNFSNEFAELDRNETEAPRELNYSLETWDNFLGKTFDNQQVNNNEMFDNFTSEPQSLLFTEAEAETNGTYVKEDRADGTFVVPADGTFVIEEKKEEEANGTWEAGGGWFLHPQSQAEEVSGEMQTQRTDSYVGFGIDDEIMAAIRNELMIKLPHAQGSTSEKVKENDEWETTERNEVFLRYNVYNTPLSPIPEESYIESSESEGESTPKQISDDDSDDWSETAEPEPIPSISAQTTFDSPLRSTTTHHRHTPSQDSCCSNDTLFNLEELTKQEQFENNNTNLLGNFNSVEEFLANERAQSSNVMAIAMTSASDSSESFLHAKQVAPLPSPDDKQWRPLPLLSLTSDAKAAYDTNGSLSDIYNEADYVSIENTKNSLISTDDEEKKDEDNLIINEDDADLFGVLADIRFNGPADNQLMSTSFSESNDLNDDQDWDSGSDTRSSSSGEFIWKEGEHEESLKALRAAPQDLLDDVKPLEGIMEESASDTSDEEDEMPEFVPSAWDKYAMPVKSALRSPEKTQTKDDGKKPRGVWFKKQKYHCVYEYPREPESPVLQSHDLWKPQPDFAQYTGNPSGLDDEFFISSSSTPFDHLVGNMSSQFFPGGNNIWSENMTPDSGTEDVTPDNAIDYTLGLNGVQSLRMLANAVVNRKKANDSVLGGLRHTRDRLKLDLPPSPSAFTSNKAFMVEPEAEPIVIREKPTFSTFGKSRFMVQHVDTPPDDQNNKNVSFEALPYKPNGDFIVDYFDDEVDDEGKGRVEIVRGEASLLDSADEDSGIESSTLERKLCNSVE